MIAAEKHKSKSMSQTNQHGSETLPFSIFTFQLSTSSTPFKFSAKEKDEETGYSYFGARYYWPEVSVWMSVDPLYADHPASSPFAFALNTPCEAIDPDGRLVIMVNGWRSMDWVKSAGLRVGAFVYAGLVGKVYAIFVKKNIGGNSNSYDRGDNPRGTKKTYGDYWQSQDLRFSDYFQDQNRRYCDGSEQPWSSAKLRFNHGVAAANQLLEDIKRGVITLTEDETIKIISHSKGGAFAAGMATRLIELYEQGDLKNRVEYVGYIAPMQPNQFSHPSAATGEQWSRFSDLITSKGFIPKVLKSEMARIANITKYHETENMDEHYGGHMMDAWHNLKPIPIILFGPLILVDFEYAD